MKDTVKKIIACSLIILLMSTHMVILGETIVTALENDIEDTNVENVKYDAYLKTSEGTKYEGQVNIEEQQTLVLNVYVKDKGVLKDAKIQLENPNFNIVEEEINNEYVKKIDKNSKEIELNSIIYSNKATIEIPIQFNQPEVFTENYFDKETVITLTGTYSNETVETVEATRIIKLNWSTELETEVAQDIEKYINLQDGKILVQQNVYTAVQNNALPRNVETIKIQTQEIEGAYPAEVIVIANGIKLETEKIKYDNQNGYLEIENKKTINQNGEVEWGDAINEYGIIYIYEANEGTPARLFNLDTTVEIRIIHKREFNSKTREKGNRIN